MSPQHVWLIVIFRFAAAATFDDNESVLDGFDGCDIINDSTSKMRCKLVHRCEERCPFDTIVL